MHPRRQRYVLIRKLEPYLLHIYEIYMIIYGYLHHRHWMRRLCLLYKCLSNNVPRYIFELIPPIRLSFRNRNSFTSFPCRTEYFKSSFFPWVMNDLNKVDPKIPNSTFLSKFQKCPNKFN